MGIDMPKSSGGTSKRDKKDSQTELTAAVRSVEVIKDTNRQLLSKHAEEMQALRQELDQTTRQYSDLQKKFQVMLVRPKKE